MFGGHFPDGHKTVVKEEGIFIEGTMRHVDCDAILMKTSATNGGIETT